jgi:hypothetical protein
MRRDLGPSSGSDALRHRPFSAGFIINTRGFEFSVQTGQQKSCRDEEMVTGGSNKEMKMIQNQP